MHDELLRNQQGIGSPVARFARAHSGSFGHHFSAPRISIRSTRGASLVRKPSLDSSRSTSSVLIELTKYKQVVACCFASVSLLSTASLTEAQESSSARAF